THPVARPAIPSACGSSRDPKHDRTVEAGVILHAGLTGAALIDSPRLEFPAQGEADSECPHGKGQRLRPRIVLEAVYDRMDRRLRPIHGVGASGPEHVFGVGLVGSFHRMISSINRLILTRVRTFDRKKGLSAPSGA